MALLRCLAMLLISIAGTTTGAQEPTRSADTPLILGQTSQKQVSVNATHTYSLKLEKDYFAQVVVEAKGVDVTLTLFAADGQQIAGSQAGEAWSAIGRVSAVAEEPQVLRLEVRALKSSAADGNYTVELTALRPAEKNDRDLVAAERLWAEARGLLSHATAQTRREGIAKAKSAAQLFLVIGNRERAADALYGAGRSYHLLGEQVSALAHLEQALSLYRELGNRRREGLLLTFIGMTHSNSGEYEKALDCHLKALELRRLLHLTKPEANSLNQIGLVYFRLGDPHRALIYHLQTLALARGDGNKLAEASSLEFVGGDYYAMEQYVPALSYFTQALEIHRKRSTPLRLITTLRQVGFTHLKMGAMAKALETFEEGLLHEREYDSEYNRANLFAGLGEAYYHLNDPGRAREYLAQALPLLRNIDDHAGQAQAHFWLARVELSQDNLSAALKEIEDSVGITETLRSSLSSPELRTVYFASVERYYGAYLEILWRLHQKQPGAGFDERALQVSERSRARSLMELLHEARVDIRHGVAAELLARERDLQQHLNAKAQAQPFLVSDEEATREQTAATSREIEKISNALLETKAEIRKQSPRYAALTQPQTLSLKDIQRTLDENTILLEYKLGEERSFLWAITRTEFSAFELPKRAEIETLSRRVYQLLTARQQPELIQTNAGVRRSAADYNEAAGRLSRMLLGPVAAALHSQRLVIVSDGTLQYIPFAALPVPTQVSRGLSASNASEIAGAVSANAKVARDEGSRPDADYQPLIAHHEIVTLPSASLINVLRGETGLQPRAPMAVAVFADPVFARDDVRVDGIKSKDNKRAIPPAPLRPINDGWLTKTSSDKGDEQRPATGPAITRLPFSRREANAILAFAAPKETYAALDFEANRANATSPALLRYRIVHFAAHGWLDSTRPELSGLVLSLVNQKGQPQDGVLRLHDIYNLQLKADLVVLSACQTALGKEVKGEGLIGLTRGFMFAGALRVAASLWKVDDLATAELMAQFYRFMLKEKLSPAASLRAAQLELIKQKRWHEPYFWAGFVLQGEWR
ncbi:MAG: CHAT domain-containing protein [Pyrinomonadaceae bacterium]